MMTDVLFFLLGVIPVLIFIVLLLWDYSINPLDYPIYDENGIDTGLTIRAILVANGEKNKNTRNIEMSFEDAMYVCAKINDCKECPFSKEVDEDGWCLLSKPFKGEVNDSARLCFGPFSRFGNGVKVNVNSKK